MDGGGLTVAFDLAAYKGYMMARLNKICQSFENRTEQLLFVQLFKLLIKVGFAFDVLNRATSRFL